METVFLNFKLSLNAQITFKFLSLNDHTVAHILQYFFLFDIYVYMVSFEVLAKAKKKKKNEEANKPGLALLSHQEH